MSLTASVCGQRLPRHVTLIMLAPPGPRDGIAIANGDFAHRRMSTAAQKNTPPHPLRVWLIDSGLPGHTIQVDTVGKILENKMGAQCEWVRAKLRLRGPVRSAARWLVDRIPPFFAPWLARAMYWGVKIPRGVPDIIISSNSHTTSICRLFARMSQAPAIYLGELHPPRSNWFDLVVVPVEMDLPNAMLTPLTQTGQTAEKAAAAARSFWPEGIPTGCWTMIIGGDGKSHTFQPEEWRALGEAMNRAAKENGIRWLISTSRRTKAENEAILQEALDPSVIAEAIWWASKPKKGLAAYIHAGERIFATRDSLTMVSEAIAVKGHAEVVYPADFRLNKNSVYERYLQRLENESRLASHPVHELRSFTGPLPEVPIEAAQEAFASELTARVRALLQQGTSR